MGDACSTDSECQLLLGASARCKQGNLSGSITYQGGYCTIVNCSNTGVDLCPASSVCLSFPRIFGEEESFCFSTGCSTSAPCRSGYDCFAIGPSKSTCLPADVADPGLQLDTTSVIHAACSTNAACRAPQPGAPFAGGTCRTAFVVGPDGGLVLDGGAPIPTGYVGGSCSRTCRIDDDCTATGIEDAFDGVCLPTSSTQALCSRGCPSPRGGQSTCRAGYVCERVLLPDSGVLPSGVCDPRCDNAGGSCSRLPDGGVRPCLSTGYCQL